jgi:HPt (histidine-containing phosphotransfer) domain-containing protein
MDGYELTAAIRGAEIHGRRAPILALTANALKGEAERCRVAGMNNYLSKPLQLADLKAALQEWLPDESTAHLPVDVRVLQHLVGDDPDIVQGFLVEFRDSLGPIAAQIEIACAGGNTDLAGAQAHKLKASARTVGALRLGALCEHLENIAHGVGSETLAEVWASFAVELRAVTGFLDYLPDDTPRQS